MDLVTVVIPSYNTARLIGDAIDSVIAQTYPHIEIIVIDDGSADGTAHVAREKLSTDCKGPWRVIELGENRGCSAARNAGIYAARGAWIQLVDSDDFLAPSKIEFQLKACESAADTAVVYSAFQRVYVDDGKISPYTPTEEPDIEGKPPIIFLEHEHCIHVGSMLIRRDILDESGVFDESLRLWEVRELQIRIAQAGGKFKKASSSQPLYFFRWYWPAQQKATHYKTADLALGWITQMLKVAQNQPLNALHLSAQDQRTLENACFRYARMLYQEDRKAFHEFVPQMWKLIGKCHPQSPLHFSLLSRCVGYENAEVAANILRKPKSLIKAAFSASQSTSG